MRPHTRLAVRYSTLLHVAGEVHHEGCHWVGIAAALIAPPVAHVPVQWGAAPAVSAIVTPSAS